jgi:predicted ester cyclase
MTGSGSTLQSFYEAVAARNLASAGRYLADDLVFSGLFETYRGPNEYLTALTKLLQVTRRLDVRKIVSQGADAVILFELETKAPVECTTLVTEWHQVVDGKINRVQSVFDGRPFARMFSASGSQGLTPVEANKQTVREFTRIFKNEHNVDGVDHLFDKGFVHHFRSPMPAGFEGLRQVGIMMNGAFPDVVVTEEDLIGCGDKVVERSSAVATHAGPMLGKSPSRRRVQWTEIHIYRLKDGKIAEHWAEVAMMELLQQIGVLPQLE